MTEREQVTAIINDESSQVLSDRAWETEQEYHSIEPITILGTVGEQAGGTLNASIVVRRHYDPGTEIFTEDSRVVEIGNLTVNEGYGNRSLEEAMIAELERVSMEAGASEIRGAVTNDDLSQIPELRIM